MEEWEAFGKGAQSDAPSADTDVDSTANGETKTVTGVTAGTASSSVGSVSSVVKIRRSAFSGSSCFSW